MHAAFILDMRLGLLNTTEAEAVLVQLKRMHLATRCVQCTLDKRGPLLDQMIVVYIYFLSVCFICFFY